ncbi:uncharacterized protein LOC133395024 [Anopheles gambiae]|uniref:uncharacterized protein LOC133395024 n=1 Tax=Anopheles gambiae TaxID=7165 RepID=UPI002AC99CAD|nr:uncharacterized protein LOC133395024 [Anopheles gambiae]
MLYRTTGEARTTRVQYQQLVTLLEEVPEIARGLFKGDQKSFWTKVESNLNALGPPITRQCDLEVWFDYKCAVKRKLRDNKKSLNATGGGPFAQKPLNDLEERVANFCNLHLTLVGNSGNCHGLKNNTINNENPPPEPSIHIG